MSIVIPGFLVGAVVVGPIFIEVDDHVGNSIILVKLFSEIPGCSRNELVNGMLQSDPTPANLQCLSLRWMPSHSSDVHGQGDLHFLNGNTRGQPCGSPQLAPFTRPADGSPKQVN